MQSEKNLGKSFVEDVLNKKVSESLSDEEFWACHYALVKKYCDLKKKAFLRDGKTISSVEEYEKELEFYVTNIITSLPKYKLVFGNDKEEESKDTYKKLLPKALPFAEKQGEEGLEDTAGKVISYGIRERLKSNDSGINISAVKFLNAMQDFDTNRQLITQEFLDGIEAKYGKQGREMTLSHVRENGLNAIQEMIEYYTKLSSYLCDFYANIEIAKQDEEDKEWSK